MWIKLLVACCANCGVLAVDTVDTTHPSQKGGAIVHGMPEQASVDHSTALNCFQRMSAS